ncbi:MAG: dGTPase, partial [Lutibacter sp.]
VAKELALASTSKEGILRYNRHPLAYLVEAADDICYTIIDFEDGINLGLIEEDFALEYLIKLVKETIDTKKYYQLQFKKDRLSYLRALAIGNLINEAANVFLKQEDAILKGEYPHSLLDKCVYEAQINDIIKISVEKIYKSREVIEKELVGYNVIAKLLDVFLTASHRNFENSLTNYDKLVINLLPESLQEPKETVYLRVLSICGFVASLTDGYALELYKKLNG